MFWNQGARKLFMAEIPDNPRAAGLWPLTEILDTSKVQTAVKQEGMAAFDVDGDGRVDLLAGMHWLKHEGGNKFRPIQIADHPGRIAAGHFKPGKVAEIVMAPGDGNGPLLFFECHGDPTERKSWMSRDLLGKQVIHGHSLVLADINGDGKLDIISKPYCWDTPRLDIWLNLGNLPGATGFGGKLTIQP